MLITTYHVRFNSNQLETEIQLNNIYKHMKTEVSMIGIYENLKTHENSQTKVDHKKRLNNNG